MANYEIERQVLSDQDYRDRFSFALGYAVLSHFVQTGETYEDIADRLDVSRYSVSRWIHGDTSPKAYQLAQLAEATGASAEFLASPPNLPVYPFPRIAYEKAHGETEAEEVTLYPSGDLRISFHRNHFQSHEDIMIELARVLPTKLRLMPDYEIDSSDIELWKEAEATGALDQIQKLGLMKAEEIRALRKYFKGRHEPSQIERLLNKFSLQVARVA